MKKILLTLLIVTFIGPLCFAQESAAPVKTASEATTETKTLNGKVESVTLADPAKGIKSEIVVVDDNANKTTVLVKSTTTIYDIDWKAISLDKIKKDDKIKLRYSATNEGFNEAASISLLKQ